MSAFPRELVDLLEPAVEAGRAALRDLEPDDVPASLRRVAAKTGGRLPPPLARALLVALDTDDWIREKALESWVGGTAPGHAASEAFLERSEGWWNEVAVALAAVQAEQLAARVTKLERDVRKTKEQLKVAKRRTAAGPQPMAGADEMEELRATLRAKATSHRREISDLKKRAQDAEEAAATLETERGEVEALARQLRDRVRSLKRELATQPGSRSGSARSRDPLGLARTLDQIASMIAVPDSAGVPAADESTASTSRAQARLPPGVAPDRPAAIKWLVERTEPYTLIVDGYNVLYLVEPNSWSTGRARRRLNEGLARLRRQARTNPRVVVVYDSAVGGSPPTTTGDVEVRFAPEGSIADDEVVAQAASAAGDDVYVVSTDREVREAAEANGACALWSEALVGYLAGRG